jgi:hypothetical protein
VYWPISGRSSLVETGNGLFCFFSRWTDEPLPVRYVLSGDHWGSVMPRFYLHLRQDGELILDDEGVELADVAAARRKAERGARELLAEAIKAGKDTVADAFVIADEFGRPLDTVLFLAVLPKSLKK